MTLSRASTYAFYGLGYLAKQSADRWVPLSEIHQAYGVPEKHLAKIFQSLVKAGILRSVRGVNGGFALARPAESVSPLDVIEVVDGPVDEKGCLLIRQPCEEESVCPINAVWRRAQEGMLAVLRQATVADMVEQPGRRFRPPRAQVREVPR